MPICGGAVRAAFVRQHSWVVATEATWPPKPHVFAVRPFPEQGCLALLSGVYEVPAMGSVSTVVRGQYGGRGDRQDWI